MTNYEQKAFEALCNAVNDAATSLETLGRLAGQKTFQDENGMHQDTYLGHFDQVRGFATSRALAAREAIKSLHAAITPQEDAYALLRAHMARAINAEWISFVDAAMDCGAIPPLSPEQKAQLLAIEQEVRQHAG